MTQKMRSPTAAATEIAPLAEPADTIKFKAWRAMITMPQPRNQSGSARPRGIWIRFVNHERCAATFGRYLFVGGTIGMRPNRRRRPRTPGEWHLSAFPNPSPPNERCEDQKRHHHCNGDPWTIGYARRCAKDHVTQLSSARHNGRCAATLRLGRVVPSGATKRRECVARRGCPRE